MLRLKAIRLLIIIFGFYSFYFVSFAQTQISVPDTLIPRGEIYSIPVSGKIEKSNIDSIRIVLRYNAKVINIKSASGSDNFIMKNRTPKLINADFNNIENATIDIFCDSTTASTSGIFCMINVEGLAGPDSSTELTPIAVYFNGEPDLLAITDAGKIIVPGSPVYQRFPEWLGQNFPNPFSGVTYFHLSIEKATKIEFKIFSNDGAEIKSKNEISESILVEKVTVSGKTKVNLLEDILETGRYLLTYKPDSELASGSYFLVMQTDNGIYNKRFLYIK